MENVKKLHLDILAPECKRVEPFWNDNSTLFHKHYWHPSLSEKNYSVQAGQFITVLKNEGKLPDPIISVSKDSQAFRIQNRPLTQMVSKKIRIFPKNPDLYMEALHTFRRMYNLVVEDFVKNGVIPNPMNAAHKAEMMAKVQEDNPKVFDYNLCQCSYRKVCDAVQALFKKAKARKGKGLKPVQLHFKSWKYDTRYFIMPKVSKNGQIFPRTLGKVFYTESVPDESYHKTGIIICLSGSVL